MKNLVIIFSILLNIILSSTLGYIIYEKHKYVPPSSEQVSNFNSNLRFSEKILKESKLSDKYISELSKDLNQVKLSAWMPSWAMTSGIRTLEAKKDEFEMVNPVFYHLNERGTITVQKTGLETLKKTLEGSNVKIVPTIAGFDPNGMKIVLEDPAKLQRHADFLIKEVDDNNFDGLDLDYESIPLDVKSQFFTLLQKISTAMKQRNKVLTIAVLSKWGDQIKYGYAPQTREVQDYAEIAKYVDQIRIMTYDFTSQGSPNPGPIAPVSWMEQVLDYAIKRIPKEKIVLGVHLYGYSWPNGEKAKALDFRDIADMKQNNNSLQLFYSDESKEGALRYNENGKTYFGYYASPETVKARLELAAKYGIHGVAFWRLGDDPI